MHRRLVVSFVVAGFLVAQWAAMPHRHSLGSPPNHDAIPHVHLTATSGSSHVHPHKHAHQTGHHHHHHHDSLPVKNKGWETKQALNGLADHDNDAVFLPLTSPIAGNGDSQHNRAMPMATLICLPSSLVIEAIPNKSVTSLRPPDEFAPGCALYLALRALRI